MALLCLPSPFDCDRSAARALSNISLAAHARLRALADEEDMGCALGLSLDQRQLAHALIATTRRAIS
jgi:hypothetical protein